MEYKSTKLDETFRYYFGRFYSQNRVLDPQKLVARIHCDAYMISPSLILFIYGFMF